MRTADKRTYEAIIKHKEYFDGRLIEIIENLKNENENSLVAISKKDAMISKQCSQILTLENKVLDQSKIIQSFVCKTKDHEIEIEEQKKTIKGNTEYIDKIKQENDMIKSDLDEALKNIKNLEKEIEKLKKEIRKLKESNSTNSNVSSSYDILSHAKKKKDINSRVKSGKKIGGQTGHPVHKSTLSNSNDEVIDKYVKKAPQAAEAVYDDEDKLLYYRTQEIDLIVTSKVIETRYHIQADGEELSKEILDKYKINPLTFSASFKSAMIYLNQKGTIPLKRLSEIIDEISNGQVHVNESTLVKWNNEFKQSSKEAIDKIVETLIKAKVINVDETGCKINSKQHWIQTANSDKAALLLHVEKRGDKESGIIKMLEGYDQILCHDYFKPYYHLQSCLHTQCNAHIERYLKAGIEFDNNEACKEILEILRTSLKKKKELISQGKYKMDDDQIEDIKTKMIDIMEKEMERYRIKNPDIKEKSKYEADYIKLFRRMIERIEEHLLFLRNFDVPYTNNEAEKVCRVVKTKKNISYQFKSNEGADAYASIMSIIMTARKNGDNALKAIEKVMK